MISRTVPLGLHGHEDVWRDEWIWSLPVDKPVTHGLVGFLLRQSGWTSSMDVFLNWLSLLSFEGGGFGEAAIAEALAEALMVPMLTSSCTVVPS